KENFYRPPSPEINPGLCNNRIRLRLSAIYPYSMEGVARRLELHRSMSGDLTQFEERWRVYKQIYDYCTRKGVAPNEINDATISSLLEVLL
ncbi:hypothetical protein, partial [Endozoicomonas ascidiicola]|uniref:hypothetical protein n=1 Tax=Endozoicomonas ascidiicola TaxID=1698521 RepID=UPI001C12AC5C